MPILKKLRSELNASAWRMSKNSTGVFTGLCTSPFAGTNTYLDGDYVLADYGTGAVMAVVVGINAITTLKHFDIPIKNIFKDVSIGGSIYR